MHFDLKSFVGLALLVIVGAGLLGLGLAIDFDALAIGQENLIVASTSRATLDELVEEGAATIGGERQIYQKWRVTILEGEFAGESMTIEYGRQTIRPASASLEQGQKVLVTISPGPGGQPVASFADFIRTRELAILAGLFVVFILAVSRWMDSVG